MHTHQILNLMNPLEHCPACGALLVSVPGGGLFPHCGFELEDPEELEVVAIRSNRPSHPVLKDPRQVCFS